MRDAPALFEPARSIAVQNVVYRDVALRVQVWDTIAETVDEILGPEDCYRLEQLPERMSVIDFGASVGTFTIGALLRGAVPGGPSGGVEVLAVEGDLKSLMLLTRNIRRCGKAAHVRPVCAFVGNTGGMPLKEFYWKGPKSLVPPLEVSTRLWDYLPHDRARVVKMDIEESEIDLFKQPRFLAFAVMAQHFLLEFHAYDGYVYADIFGQLGFQVELTGCGNPAPAYSPTMARGMLYARK